MSFHRGFTIATAAARERPAIGVARQAQGPRPSVAGANAAPSNPVSSVVGGGITRQELRKALAETQKRAELCERRLAELNHRVANTLQIVSGLVRAQQHRLANPLAKEALETAAIRLDAVARLHRHLCRQDATERLDLGRFIAEIAPAIEKATGLSCQLDVEPVEVSSEAALHLVTAAIELVLNARKHAYRDCEGGLIGLGCRRDPDGRLRLSVADHGPGLSGDFDVRRSAGLGMEIIGSTVRQLGGELLAESDRDGTRFTMLVALV